MVFEVLETIKGKKTKTVKTKFDKREDAIKYAEASHHRTEVYQVEYKKKA